MVTIFGGVVMPSSTESDVPIICSFLLTIHFLLATLYVMVHLDNLSQLSLLLTRR